MGLIIARRGWLALFPLIVVLGALALIILAWMLPRPLPTASKG